MHDHQFQSQFENCILPKEFFNHRGHLRIAWIYLSAHPLEEAVVFTINGIKRYAASLGAEHIYHETLTRTWVHLVYYTMQRAQTVSFADFIVKNHDLLNKDLPLQYFSRDLLYSEKARIKWIEPDISTFPTTI